MRAEARINCMKGTGEQERDRKRSITAHSQPVNL